MTIAELPLEELVDNAPAAARSERRRYRHQAPRKNRHLIRGANLVLLLICSLIGLSAIGNAVGWWRTDTVLTGSMRPGIQPGDVEILRPERVSALRVGQIVAFHPPRDTFTVTHRVYAIHHHDGLWITTKGDANDVTDPWGTVRVVGSTVWTVRAIVPDAGFLSVWVRTPLPHLILVLTIILSVCAIAFEMIWRT